MITFCCFYTENTPYEQLAKDYFEQSPYFYSYYSKEYEKTEFKIITCSIPNKGSWIKNVAMKPAFIYDVLEMHKDNKDLTHFVFLDADSKVIRKPVLFFELAEKNEVDIAYHVLDWNTWYKNNTNTKEVLSGTLFIKNSEKMRDFCKEWHEEALKTNIWEQKVLQNLLEKKDLTKYEFSVEYCYINSLPNGEEPHVKVEQPFIKHYQASRTLRKKIK